MEAREVYWTAAGHQWTEATLRPHLWRAMVEELTNAARQDYLMGFTHAKQLDMKQGQGGKGQGGKGRGRRQQRNFQINPEALDKLKAMPEFEQLVSQAPPPRGVHCKRETSGLQGCKMREGYTLPVSSGLVGNCKF
jgi:hypothetical protein